MPSPRLAKGKLSAADKRERMLFLSETVGCADRHAGPFLTDLKSYDVGTEGEFDEPAGRFDTPSLIEVWRSAPYLQDGQAATLREVLTKFQSDDQPGVTSHLTPEQTDVLAEFLLSQ